MCGPPVFFAGRWGHRRRVTIVRNEGIGMACSSMTAWQIGTVLAMRLLAWGLLLTGEGHADHLSPKHDPWAQPWEPTAIINQCSAYEDSITV